ncbi:hypothetical protein L9F63_003555, partial [Diploptera punctata]
GGCKILAEDLKCFLKHQLFHFGINKSHRCRVIFSQPFYLIPQNIVSTYCYRGEELSTSEVGTLPNTEVSTYRCFPKEKDGIKYLPKGAIFSHTESE